MGVERVHEILMSECGRVWGGKGHSTAGEGNGVVVGGHGE